MGKFSDLVLVECSKIPKGKLCTYSKIAIALGSRKSARAVGNALNKNKNPYSFSSTKNINEKRVPCHRVIRSDGFVGGFVHGQEAKIKLLRREGVMVSKDGFVDLSKYCVD